MKRKFKSLYAEQVTLHSLKPIRKFKNRVGMNVRVQGKVIGRVHMTLLDHMPNFPLYTVSMLIGAEFKDISEFDGAMKRKKALTSFYLTWQNAVETLLLRWSKRRN